MSTYNYQSSFFSSKDALAPGNPLKLVTGQDFEEQFISIDPAIKARISSVDGAYTGTLTGVNLTLSGSLSVNTIDGGTF